MSCLRLPGPTCVTTAPAIDEGTLARARSTAPGGVGAKHNGHPLYKRMLTKNRQRVPGMSGAAGDAALLKAKADALKLLEQRQTDLTKWDQGTQENFLAWFGTTSDPARKRISHRIVKAIAKLKALKLTDFVAIPVPRRRGKSVKQYQHEMDDYNSYFAYVEPGVSDRGKYEFTVHIGPEFASADETTRAGTIIHEISHFLTVGGTDDVSRTFVGDPRPKNRREMYGYTKAMRLSMGSPKDALNNADNFEFFVEKHDPADHDLDLDGAGDFPDPSSSIRRI